MIRVAEDPITTLCFSLRPWLVLVMGPCGRAGFPLKIERAM